MHQKKDIQYSIIARHDAHTNLIADNNYSHVLLVNHYYVQRIVRTISPQSMNVGVQCENYKKSIMQLEAIHVRPRINTSAVVKKGNRTQKKTKVSP